MKKSFIVLCACIFTMALLSRQDAWSCTCFDKLSVQEAFIKEEYIFIAKITGPIKNSEIINLETFPYIETIRGTVVMSIEKVYKGELKPGEMIDLLSNTLTCDPSFTEVDIGREFLIYSKRYQQGKLQTFYRMDTCGRSGDVKIRADDILYLENLTGIKEKR